MEQNFFKVSVRCMTFNQASYIADALNGFTMQVTNFPFVCCIVDDASTDDEPEILRKYLQDYFDLENKSVVRNEETDDYKLCFAQHKENRNCFFAVLWLKYNHYGSKELKYKKLDYISGCENNAKYIALCEGDDYWIDARKLQKQVDSLETDSNTSMVCSSVKLFSEKKHQFIGNKTLFPNNCYIEPHKIILGGGLFISTCSIVYNKKIKDNYPIYCQKCHVGDYPLQIMAAMKGNVFFFSEPMAVYRVDNCQSWTGREKKLDKVSQYNGFRSEIDMLKGFAVDYPRYKSCFYERISIYLNYRVPVGKEKRMEYYEFVNAFKEDFEGQSLYYKLQRYFKARRYFVLIRIINLLHAIGVKFSNHLEKYKTEMSDNY